MKKKNLLLFGAQGCGSAITEAFFRYAKIKYDYYELFWDDRKEWPKIIGQYNALPQVPTVVLPNDEVLTETLATMVYANRKKKGLIPSKKLEDKFWRWVVFMMTNIYPTFTLRDNASQFVSDKKAQEELSSAMMERRKGLWLAMEKECGKKWFLGAEFSAIDIYIGIMTFWTPGKDWFKDNCPRLTQVANRIQKAQPFKKLIQEHMS